MDIVSLNNNDKLTLLREHKESLVPVLEKNDWLESLEIDKAQVITKEMYKSHNLWQILITGKYNFIEGNKNY
ncbi:MAG: hypothetical protein JXA99_17250 [Candidatus Lokiarchaeota archaeon]|nr:hypothetical protein [Candidatus Lokiarchaeota archaeon]